MVGTIALAARLIWEMTVLTWKQGPQMVGFSLAHGVGVLLFLFPLLLCLWLLAVITQFIVWKTKQQAPASSSWTAASCGLLLVAVLSLPQSFWNVVFVRQLARGPHASESFVYAAGSGDSYVVRAMLKRGTDVNATDHEGNTALHIAAGGGRTALVSYLLAHGAAVNKVNLYGDSPLELAVENHRTGVENILLARGAERLRGDAEQRRRASNLIVKQAIEEQTR